MWNFLELKRTYCFVCDGRNCGDYSLLRHRLQNFGTMKHVLFFLKPSVGLSHSILVATL